MNKIRSIKSIKKIKLNLFDLKPKKSLLKILDFYNYELSKVFTKKGKPIKKYFEVISCPICCNEDSDVITKIDNFEYNRCSSCKAIYNKMMLKNSFLEEMYSSGIYKNYFKTFVMKSQKLRKNTLERRKVMQLSSFFKKPGKLLDVGCGSGSLLKECKDIGWDVQGLDPSSTAVKVAKKKYGIDVFQTTFEKFQTKIKFDCIVFIGIEHLQDPLGAIAKAKKLLNKNGIIFFETPSADSFLMKFVTKYPFSATRFIESGRHYLFFSIETIKFIVKKFNMSLEHYETNGLDIQTILLKKFDKISTDKILDMQDIINDINLGDHYRVFLKKK